MWRVRARPLVQETVAVVDVAMENECVKVEFG